MSIDAFDTAIASDSVKLKMCILEATNTLMRQKPFDKLTVREICQEAHVSRQTFYNHFRDKTDLAVWLEASIVNARLLQVGCALTWEEAFELILFELPSNASALAWGIANSSQRRKFISSCAQVIARALLHELEWRRGAPMTQELRFQCATFPYVLIVIVDALLVESAFPEFIELDKGPAMEALPPGRSRRKAAARNMVAYVPDELAKAMQTKRRSSSG